MHALIETPAQEDSPEISRDGLSCAALCGRCRLPHRHIGLVRVAAASRAHVACSGDSDERSRPRPPRTLLARARQPRPGRDLGLRHPHGHRGRGGPRDRQQCGRGCRGLLPRPLDAPAVHDADDAHPRAERGRERDAALSCGGPPPGEPADVTRPGGGAGGRARRGAGVSLLGARRRAGAADRDSLRRGGRKEGHPPRLSLSPRRRGRLRRRVAVRAVVERRAAHGHPGSLPGGHRRHHGPHAPRSGRYPRSSWSCCSRSGWRPSRSS